MLKKLRLKFIFINMGIAAAMLLVIFSLVFHFTKTDLENKSISMLDSLAQNVKQPNGPHQQNVQLPYFIIRINIHGDIAATGHTYYDLSDETFIKELIQQVYTSEITSGIIKKYDLRYSRISSPGNQHLIFLDISSQTTALSTLVQVCILMGVVSLIAFWGISILLAKWAIKPVEKAWQQQQQFVSDASHELKTPLTVIMSNAELMQGAQADDTNREHFLESILLMARRMRSLVEGMLELARAENGQIKQNFALLDYSALVSAALLPFDPVLFEHGLTLQSDIEQGIMLNGSSDHLHQVVDILLDNAAKYGKPGHIHVSLRRRGKAQCLLSVSNPGEPIAREELEKIFDRFYRGDQARVGSGSFGLGLPIARRIVQDHKGKIWAQSNETGNCFYVQLPCQ